MILLSELPLTYYVRGPVIEKWQFWDNAPNIWCLRYFQLSEIFEECRPVPHRIKFRQFLNSEHFERSNPCTPTYKKANLNLKRQILIEKE